MPEIGKINTLEVIRETENGFYLDGLELGEILMPRKFTNDEIKKSGKAEVFIYSDSEDRLVATTETPLAMVGDFKTAIGYLIAFDAIFTTACWMLFGFVVQE